MKQFLSKLLLLAGFTLTVNFCHAQAGTLDSSFGVNGDAPVTNLGFTSEVIAVQSDGKIILGGTSPDTNSGFFRDMSLVRLTSFGKIDSSFGVNGKASFHFENVSDSYAKDIFIQSDGKILLGGTGYMNSLNGYGGNFQLVRCQTNGYLDSSFGINGQVVTDIGTSEDQILSIDVQIDGKIIAGGQCYSEGGLARYNPNGTLDLTFGKNGIVYPIPEPLYSLKLSNSKKIITAGFGSTDFGVLQYLNNGTRDSSFGNNGEVFIDFSGNIDVASDIVLAENGDMIVAGTLYTMTGQSLLGLTRLKPAGIIDSSFGSLGRIITDLGGNSLVANSVLVQNDGKIIVTASTNSGSGNFIVARLKNNGLIDSSFGTNGLFMLNFGPYDDYKNFNSSALQIDGKILITGANVSQSSHTIRMKNDDPITVNLQRNISVTEGNSGTTAAQFKIVLNRPSAYDVQVNYTSINGNATSGSDYVATVGKAVIKAGKTSKLIVVNVIGDNIKEPNEKFALIIGKPVNAQLGPNDTATCTIKNDDPGFTASSADAVNAEIKTTGIKLYPNPAKDLLRIEGLDASRKTTISITGMNGNIVLNRSVNSSTASLNIQQLAAGVYELRATSGNKVQAIKFVKE